MSLYHLWFVRIIPSHGVLSNSLECKRMRGNLTQTVIIPAELVHHPHRTLLFRISFYPGSLYYHYELIPTSCSLTRYTSNGEHKVMICCTILLCNLESVVVVWMSNIVHNTPSYSGGILLLSPNKLTKHLVLCILSR